MKNIRRKEGTPPTVWSSLEEQAIRMRRAPTQAEERIWKHLRSGKLAGLKFRRQHPVGRFIVDFYCVSAGLVVEVDGPIHDEQADADAERQLYLEAMGLRVLRFSNDEALRNTFAVLDVIAEAALACSPLLARRGVGGEVAPAVTHGDQIDTMPLRPREGHRA